MAACATATMLPAHSGETAEWYLRQLYHHRARFAHHHRDHHHFFRHGPDHHHPHLVDQPGIPSGPEPEPSSAFQPAEGHHHRGHRRRHHYLAARRSLSPSSASHGPIGRHYALAHNLLAARHGPPGRHRHYPGHFHHGRHFHQHLAARHGRFGRYAGGQGPFLRHGSPELNDGPVSQIGHILEHLSLHAAARSRSTSPATRGLLRRSRASSVPLSQGHHGRHGSGSPRHRHHLTASAVHLSTAPFNTDVHQHHPGMRRRAAVYAHPHGSRRHGHCHESPGHPVPAAEGAEGASDPLGHGSCKQERARSEDAPEQQGDEAPPEDREQNS